MSSPRPSTRRRLFATAAAALPALAALAACSTTQQAAAPPSEQPVKLTTAADVLRLLGEAIEPALSQKQSPRAALDDAARAAEPFIKEG